MPRIALPIRFRLDSRSVSGETLVLEAGAEVLVLTSCSADLGIELRSAYLSGEEHADLLVAESGVIRAAPAELGSRWLPDAREALNSQRRRVLYDHLQRFQDLALEAGHALSFDGVEPAVAQLDPLGAEQFARR